MSKIVNRLIKIFLLAGVLIMYVGVPLYAQVEHNYKVDPQSTNCDSLKLTTLPITEAVSIIEHTTFRFQQQFKISRTYGVMNARYFSCDGKLGYLIIKVDKEDYIYIDVPEPKWKLLISSADINAFYNEEIKGIYEVITENEK